MDEWVGAIGLDVHECRTHSLRQTKAARSYKATGNLRAIEILLGYTKIEMTVRYLGVDVDDALTLSEVTCTPDWYRSEVESFALMADG